MLSECLKVGSGYGAMNKYSIGSSPSPSPLTKHWNGRTYMSRGVNVLAMASLLKRLPIDLNANTITGIGKLHRLENTILKANMRL